MKSRFLLRFGELVGLTLGLWMCSKELLMAWFNSIYTTNHPQTYFVNYICLGDGLQQLDSYAELSKSYSFEDMNLDTLEFLRKDC